MLLAFRATLPELKGSLPSRVLVAKWGRNDSVKGSFTVGSKTQRFLAPLQKMLGFDRVCFDFEHNTVPGTPEYDKTQEPRTVAAHGVPRVVVGEGIYLEDLKWTPEGEASVKGGHHPDISPTIKTDEGGEVVFLHSAALCRQGSVPDLQIFNAALTPAQLSAFSAALGAPISPSSMNYKELLCLLLGLDHNSATDAQITEASKGFAQKLASAIGQAGTLQTMSVEFAQLKKDFGALQTAHATREREDLTAAALRDGKLIPHGAPIDALSNEAFKALLDSLPKDVVPVEKRTPEFVKTFTAPSIGSPDTGAEEAVRRQLGISEADWNKK